MKVAVVTGAASGFGLALTRRLLAAGWRVHASDERDPSTWPGDLVGSGLVARRVDVRSDAEVAALADIRRVDLLVNNAGYAVFGAQEEVPLEVVRDLFEVNVLGVVRVTRAVLPAVRAARGTVVQLSSIAGRTVFPESGFYAATKYAVEALSEALYQETCTFGVRLRVIEPGSFATGFLSTAAARSPAPPPGSPYDGLRPMWMERKVGVLEPPQDPERVADAILAALADPSPFRRVPVGPDAERILAVKDRLGPDGWSLQAGQRNGAAPGPTPARVRALPEAEKAELRFLREARHLDHWSDDARAALD